MKPKVNVKIEKDSDGWWGYCPRGWRNGMDPLECLHWFHEDTKKELMATIKLFIEPCDCEMCSQGD